RSWCIATGGRPWSGDPRTWQRPKPCPLRKVTAQPSIADQDNRKPEGEQGMGASSAEIDRQIRETRGQLDEKLALLEKRAASGARRYGRIAAGVAAGVAAIAIGVVLYRRRRQRSVV